MDKFFLFIIFKDLDNRPSSDSGQMAHIININVKDNLLESAKAARLFGEIAEKFRAVEDLDEEIEDILGEFSTSINQNILYSVKFY